MSRLTGPVWPAAQSDPGGAGRSWEPWQFAACWAADQTLGAVGRTNQEKVLRALEPLTGMWSGPTAMLGTGANQWVGCLAAKRRTRCLCFYAHPGLVHILVVTRMNVESAHCDMQWNFLLCSLGVFLSEGLAMDTLTCLSSATEQLALHRAGDC